jgi:hypothetical protein
MLVTSSIRVPRRHRPLVDAASGRAKIASGILIGRFAKSRA